MLKEFALEDNASNHNWFIPRIIGHPGMDWGSYSDVAGYNRYYGFSFVIT